MAELVRMADIAARLGISTVSVSKALNGDKGVSEETRQRVLDTAAQMGYQGPLRHRKEPERQYVLSILIPARYLDTTETFYLHLYQHVLKQAALMNCVLLMETLEDAQAERGDLPRLMADRRTDGLILLGNPPFDYAKRMRGKWQKPVIYLDFVSPGADRDAVISNNMYGTAALTEYLVSKGHRRIGFLGTLNVTDSINDRYLGYCRGLMQNHLPFRRDWCLDDRDQRTGEYCEIRLPEELPTAFVCNCDMAANRMIEALNGHGLRVPENISVVGFDDYLPPNASVPVTTWNVDAEEMARVTVQTLVARIRHESGYPSQQIVSGHLVIRDTVREI